MCEFIYNNIQWIFSGIGVTILIGIASYFKKNKSKKIGISINKSKNIKIENNKNQNISIDDSESIDVKGNINNE